MNPGDAREPSSYDQGHIAGMIDARLADHDQHLGKINGAMDRVADQLADLVLAVQRLGDAAQADRATVLVTATALEKAAQARRESAEMRWSPRAKFLAAVMAVAAAAEAIVLIYSALQK